MQNTNSDALTAFRQEILKSKRSLPISSACERFVKEVKSHDSLIVIGETASGKTTQIPQFLLQNGLAENGMIACTQPRRVAAVTIAERVASEMGVDVGSQVGYSVRFNDCTSELTKIKFMTDGMLLREAIGDKMFLQYSCILLDEAHERTVHTDVLFGLVKHAQKLRNSFNSKFSKLKVIVMSATMDADCFSSYFNHAPVLYVQGRLHQITMRYIKEKQSNYQLAALSTIFQLHEAEPSQDDILVFLTGQEEIESMAKTIKDISGTLDKTLPKLVVCPLYASLPHSQQLRAFKKTPDGQRKVVLSTNIAETSITIKGIKFVIDTGKVKAKTYYPASGFEVLSVQWVSQAQSWQRAGRAGRERPGVVLRLYTEEAYNKLPCNTVPEIQRCNLSNVILQLKAVGVMDVARFEFIDAPSPATIKAGLEELVVLGALVKDDSGGGGHKLTKIGKLMSHFPLEPKLSKAILASTKHHCVEEMITVVAMLSVDAVLFQSPSKSEEAQACHKKFTASEGDFATLLNVYRAFKQSKLDRAWCYDNFVNYRNMCTALDVRKQLRELCVRRNIQLASSHRDLTGLRRSIAAGLFANAAELQSDGTYRVIHSGQTVHVHPSSCLFQCKAACVVYRELVHTSKCYMRCLCVVDSDWLYDSAPEYFRQKLKGHR